MKQSNHLEFLQVSTMLVYSTQQESIKEIQLDAEAWLSARVGRVVIMRVHCLRLGLIPSRPRDFLP